MRPNTQIFFDFIMMVLILALWGVKAIDEKKIPEFVDMKARLTSVIPEKVQD